MGLVLEMGVKIRNSVTISIRTCQKSVCNHPFVVAMLLYLMLLHRWFPSAFSLLLSVSPVFVCSAVLLGTLLVFGQPNNIPEIEKEQKIGHDIASFRTGVSRDGIVVVEKDGSFSMETLSGKTREVADSSEVEDYDGSIGYVPLVDESLQHNQRKKRVTEDMERELDSKELESWRNIHKEKVRNLGMTRDVEVIEKQHYLVQKVRDENRESVNAHKGDYLEPSLNGSGCDDDADNDEASDSRSDRAESSSSDASMADILRILDELHPLLDLDAPQPAHMSHDEFDAESDKSNDGSNESDEDIENQGREVEEDGADEEEAQSGKEDESKSAIKWTEDDEKNVMDLRNLELERNQCLETLIARRRATKSFSLTAEKNLIDLDGSYNPFNVTQLSTTRHNPFDPSYDSSYDSMGLPPIPGSAPSILLPRRDPFHLPYESNEEKPDLKGDCFEQGFMSFQPKDTLFSRHESFSLGPSGLGDAKQERQDLKWRPVFVPERLASEGTSYSSLQRQSSDFSDSKLSSNADTESVSSAADTNERKFSPQDFTKEAEVISNIYHAYDLVGHGSQSSEDVDSLEMERAGKREAQHDELEIKVGKVENLEPSLSGTGGLANPVEITIEVQSKPEPFRGDKSSRSSLSSLLEVDEIFSDVRKGGPTSLEPRGDHAVEFAISPQPPLEESEIQFKSGMLDDNQHKEPIYDSSPTASERILSFDSISSDTQAEISKMVTLPASAGMPVPFVDQDSDLHGERIEKGTSGYEEIGGATSKVRAADSTGKGSNSEADVNPTKNLDAKAASSNSSYQYVPSKGKPPSQHKRDLSWSDKPRLDDQSALHEEDNILSESKEDSSIIQDVNVVEVREVQDPGLTNLSSVTSESTSSKEIASSNIESVVQEPTTIHTALKHVSEGNIGELPKPSDSKDGSKELKKNAAGTTEEIASSNTGSSVQESITTQSASKEVSECNVRELPKQSNSKDGSDKVETNAGGSRIKISSNNIGSGVKEATTTDIAPKQVSEGNVGELPKPSDSKKGTNAVEPTKQISSSNTGSCAQESISTNTAMKQVLESNVGKFPEPSNSMDRSSELRIIAVGSTKENASSTTGSDVQETVTTNTVSKQVPIGNLGELPKPSDSKDGLTKIGTYAVSFTKEVASSNAGSGVQETVTISEGNVGELSKPSNSKDESRKVGSNAVSSPKELASTDARSSVHETITPHTTSKQVLEGNAGELPKPSDSKDGSTNIETNVVGSTKEVAPSNGGSDVQGTITTHSALKQVSEGNVGELPKPSNSKEGSEKVGTSAVGSTKEVASSNAGSDVQEIVGTHVALKQVSEGNGGELPKPSNSKDESEKLGTNAVGSSKKIASTNKESSVHETTSIRTALNQVSEGNVGELPKPLDCKDGSTKIETNAVGSTKEVAPSNSGSGFQETIITDGNLKQVSEGKVGALSKPSDSKGELTKVGTNAVGSTKEIAANNTGSSVQETITTDGALNQVLEGKVGVLSKPLDSKGESTIIGTNAVGSTKEIAASNTGSGVQETVTTHTALNQVSDGNAGEHPKQSNSKDGSSKLGTNALDSPKEIASSNTGSGVPENISTHTAFKQVSEGKVGGLPKLSDSKDESTRIETKAVGATTETSSNTGVGGQKIITTDGALKQASEGTVGEVPKSSNSNDASAKVGTNVACSTKEIASTNAGSVVQDTMTTHMASKQVSEGNVGELPKPSNSNDASTKVGTIAAGSTKEIASTNTGFVVQDTITTHTAPKQISKGNGGELPKSSDSKDESTKVGPNAVCPTKEITPSITGSAVQDTNTIHTALKQVSEGRVGELPKVSNLKDESTKLGTNAVGSTKEIASISITAHTALNQVSYGNGNAGEHPKQSNSKDGSSKLGTNALDSPKEIASSNTGSGVPENISTHTAFKQVSEGKVGGLPKLSDSKDESTRIETKAVGATTESSSNTGAGGQKIITTDGALKQASEDNVGEVPKSSNSNDSLAKVGTNVAGSTKEIASTNAGSVVQDTMTTHMASKQVSEGNVGELPKPSNSNDASTKAGTIAAGSTKEIASTNTGFVVQDTITTHMAPKQISKGNGGELPKSSDLKDESTKVGTNAVCPAKEITPSIKGSAVQDTDTTHTALKQVSPKVSNLKDESTKVGTNAVDSTKEIASSNITTHTGSKQV